jgi:hypothetical protein
MNKHLLVILSIVMVAAGIFYVKRASAACKNGMCGRTQKTVQVRKPQASCTNGSCSKAKKAQPVSGCKNGMCSRRK